MTTTTYTKNLTVPIITRDDSGDFGIHPSPSDASVAAGFRG